MSDVLPAAAAAPARAGAAAAPFLDVRGLSKSYPSPRGPLPVLRDLSLVLDAGRFAAVVGASGVGKSTLLHVLGTLDPPDGGDYRLDGHEVWSLRGAALAAYRNRTIGFVFQFHHLLPEFSALENVMMPALIGGVRFADAAARAHELLDELGLAAREPHRPAELSGGEQQRVAIARAMMNRPRLLLLDEPTGNLDARTGDAVFATFRELRRRWGTTALITTHNDRLAASCDVTYRLEDGRLVPPSP